MFMTIDTIKDISPTHQWTSLHREELLFRCSVCKITVCYVNGRILSYKMRDIARRLTYLMTCEDELVESVLCK